MGVHIEVVDGECSTGRHKVGDVLVIEHATPAGMCLGAWNALAPYVTALLFGANFPWEPEEGTARIHCPDPNGITFELKRIGKEK